MLCAQFLSERGVRGHFDCVRAPGKDGATTKELRGEAVPGIGSSLHVCLVDLWPGRLTLAISGGVQRRPLHAVV